MALPTQVRKILGNSGKVRSNLDAAKATAFVAALRDVPSGRANWASYQRLTADILEFLFCPPLDPPRYEFLDAARRNRRDVIFENSDREGYWSQLRNDYGAHYIVVDAKNYDGEVAKRPVLDIAGYLKSRGCGLFALLVSRKGPSESGQHETCEQWRNSGKMIVHLDDGHIEEMLRLREGGGQPQEVIRRQIADFRTSL